MRKILVITGDYWPLPSANGLCLDAILKELNKKGYFAEVVSFAKKNETLNLDYCVVHNIETNNVYRKSKNIFKNIFNFIRVFFSHPLFKKKDMDSIERKALNIMASNIIDFVLCVQRPAASSYIGVKIKKRYPKTPFYLYEMDSLTDNGSNYIGWEKVFKNRNKRLETKVFKTADRIFYLKSHETYYKKNSYSKRFSKMFCIDTPLLDRSLFDLSKSMVKKEKTTLEFVYSGVLTMECRSPASSIEFIKELNKTSKAHYSFYSRGNAVNFLKDMGNKYPSMITHNDYIPRNDLDQAILLSDYLISIGESFNDKAFSFPSKIIYYMSFGKPIIHFAYDNNDLCIDYLKKYPLSLVLFVKDEPSKNVALFLNFVEETEGKTIDFNEIESEFFMNSPQYTVGLLLKR